MFRESLHLHLSLFLIKNLLKRETQQVISVRMPRLSINVIVCQHQVKCRLGVFGLQYDLSAFESANAPLHAITFDHLRFKPDTLNITAKADFISHAARKVTL